jgi:hypothetical protein
VVGFTLLLTGLGFGILAVGGALRSGDTALSGFHKQPKATKDPAPTT